MVTKLFHFRLSEVFKDVFRRNRKRLSILGGVVVFAVVVSFIGPEKVQRAFSTLSPKFLIILVLFELATEWGRAAKWLLGLGKRKDAVWLFFFSKAGGNISPARIGEFAPLLLSPYRTTTFFSWILIDRLLEMGATLLLGSLGFLLLVRSGIIRKGELFGSAILVPVILLACLVVLGVLFGWRFSPAKTKRGLCIGKFREAAASLIGEIQRLRAKLPWVSVLTIALTLTDMFAGVVLYRAFGCALSLWVVALATAIHGVVSVFPFTPGFLGIPYIASGTVLHLLAGVNYEIVASAVAVHLVIINLVFWSSTTLAFFCCRTSNVAVFDQK